MSDSDSTQVPFGGPRARGIVDWAKRQGAIPPATHFECEDCGRQAEVYDHRDYGKPLLLAPVCQSCNVKRGGAIPAEPILVSENKRSSGYIVDAFGVRGASFEVVSFSEEMRDWPTELAMAGLESEPEPEPATLWSTWK